MEDLGTVTHDLCEDFADDGKGAVVLGDEGIEHKIGNGRGLGLCAEAVRGHWQKNGPCKIVKKWRLNENWPRLIHSLG
jgi:hypothetical protein